MLDTFDHLDELMRAWTEARVNFEHLDHEVHIAIVAYLDGCKNKSELARALGFSRSYLGDIQAGRRHISHEFLKRLSEHASNGKGEN